jgi:hypothetical protein
MSVQLWSTEVQQRNSSTPLEKKKKEKKRIDTVTKARIASVYLHQPSLKVAKLSDRGAHCRDARQEAPCSLTPLKILVIDTWEWFGECGTREESNYLFL